MVIKTTSRRRTSRRKTSRRITSRRITSRRKTYVKNKEKHDKLYQVRKLELQEKTISRRSPKMKIIGKIIASTVLSAAGIGLAAGVTTGAVAFENKSGAPAAGAIGLVAGSVVGLGTGGIVTLLNTKNYLKLLRWKRDSDYEIDIFFNYLEYWPAGTRDNPYITKYVTVQNYDPFIVDKNMTVKSLKEKIIKMSNKSMKGYFAGLNMVYPGVFGLENNKFIDPVIMIFDQNKTKYIPIKPDSDNTIVRDTNILNYKGIAIIQRRLYDALKDEF